MRGGGPRGGGGAPRGGAPPPPAGGGGGGRREPWRARDRGGLGARGRRGPVAGGRRIEDPPHAVLELDLHPHVQVGSEQFHRAAPVMAVLPLGRVGAHDDAGVDALGVEHEGHERRVLLVVPDEFGGFEHALEAVGAHTRPGLDAVLLEVEAGVGEVVLDGARGRQGAVRVLGGLGGQGFEPLGEVLVRVGEGRGRQVLQLAVRRGVDEGRFDGVGHLRRGAGGERRVRPLVEVEALAARVCGIAGEDDVLGPPEDGDPRAAELVGGDADGRGGRSQPPGDGGADGDVAL